MSGPSTDDKDRFHVCVTCGRLKHEDLFEDGDCTCKDCYDKGSGRVNWTEAGDGGGFILVDEDRNAPSVDTDKDRFTEGGELRR